MSENQITDIVRRLVYSLQNPPDASNAQTGESSSSRQDNHSVQQELGQRFQLPRVQSTSTAVLRPSPRNGSGRFVPYTTAAKRKGKAKAKSPAELIIKDVCLLPAPDWNQVPRRQIKEDLVRQNFFIDAWTLDKAWSQDKLRNELYNLFKDHLLGQDTFEFVKSVGNTISKVKLPEGQEANARIIRHISGNGPIYIRSLSKLDSEQDLDDLDSEEPTTSDIRSYVSRNNDSDGDTFGDHPNVSNIMLTGDMHPSSNRLASSRNCVVAPAAGEGVWTLCDLETQQLREMFPVCPENILTGASTTCASIESAVDYVMNILPDSANDKPSGTCEVEKKDVSLKDILKQLRPPPGAPMRLTVSRSSIFADSVSFFKQRDFDFRKLLKVTFEGEPAIDGGGPRREFFTVVLREVLSPSAIPRLFEGRENRFLPLHNTDALRANLYKVAGRIVAASITQGGPGFPYFPKAVYAYFQNPRPNDLTEYLTQDDVVDMEYLDALRKLDNLTKDDETTVAGEVQALLIDSGFPNHVNLENRFQAMTSLCLHGILLSRKAELDQFLLGLGPLVESIRKHPDIMEPLFVACGSQPPTADDLLLLIRYEGVDDAIMQYFTRYVRAQDARIPSVLMFATGANAIPPMGFFNPSTITVLQNASVFPNANTCPLELELPGEVKSYEEFKQNMDIAMNIQEEGFGIV